MGKLTPQARTAGLLLLLATTSATAQDSPRALIERAIAAHGGSERLSRTRADKMKLQGKILVPGKDGPNLVSFTADRTVQLPGQFKFIARLEADKQYTLAQILSGDKAYVSLDGQPVKPEPAAVASLRESLRLVRVSQLVPLLNDRSYELVALGEAKVNDRVAFGVKVVTKGRKDIRLYFDHETGLLTKTEHFLEDGGGKTVMQEEFYGDFKDFAGYRRWTKMAAFRDGKKLMEAEVVDVKYFDRLDDSEFKP